MQRILSILGWVGTASSSAPSPFVSSGRSGISTPIYAAWAGLALVVLYTLGQWREIVAYFRRRNARYGAIASVSVLVVLGILVAVNYLSARQNKRWDLTANQQNSLVGTDRQAAAGPRRAGEVHGVRPADRLRAVPPAPRRSTAYNVEAGDGRLHRPRHEAGRGARSTTSSTTAPSSSSTWADANASRPTPSRTSPTR